MGRSLNTSRRTSSSSGDSCTGRRSMKSRHDWSRLIPAKTTVQTSGARSVVGCSREYGIEITDAPTEQPQSQDFADASLVASPQPPVQSGEWRPHPRHVEKVLDEAVHSLGRSSASAGLRRPRSSLEELACFDELLVGATNASWTFSNSVILAIVAVRDER